MEEMNLETELGAWESMGDGVVGREGDGEAVPDEIRLPHGAYILSWIEAGARHVTRIEYHQPSGVTKSQREEALQWINVLLSDNAITDDMIRQEPPAIDFDMQPFGHVQSWTVHQSEPCSGSCVPEPSESRDMTQGIQFFDGFGLRLQPVISCG
jgi:hypothetical protein